MNLLNKFLIVFCLFIPLSSCIGLKHLEENEVLLVEQNIKGNKAVSTGELEDFYRQEPNLQFPFIPWAPYVSIYYLGKKFYDKDEIRRDRDELAERFDEKIAKAEEKGRDTRADRLRQKKKDKIEKKEKVLEEGNLLMRIGEPISVLDSSLTKQTAEQMELYLHSKGFFHGEVDYNIKINNRKAKVNFLVDENKPFIIDTAFLTVTNEKIREIIERSQQDSYIDTTQRYNQEDLSLERTRIDNLLKNNGYFEFSPQYIEFNVDTTLGDRRVSVETVILNPANRVNHKQFKIDSVIFTTDATIRGDLTGRQSRFYRGITYRFFEEKYSKKVLDNRVFLRPDSLYSRQSTLETQKQLANLDMFKFINVTYDTSGGQFNAMVYTSPLKKFQTNNEVGFTYSQGIPGPFFTSTWTNRNTFGGLEILELNLRAGIEGVPGTTDPSTAYASQQAGANLSVTFPTFIAPLGPDLSNRLGKLNPKTRLLIGYAFTNRPEFIRQNFNTSITYSWQTEKRKKDNVYSTLYSFSPMDVSVIDSEFQGKAGEMFRNLLEEWFQQGNPYIRTFDPSFVSSMYTFAVFNKNNYGTYMQNSRLIRPYIESGGTTQNFVDFDFTTERPERAAEELRAFRFLKFSNDYRQFYFINDKNGLAWRLNAGVGVPYGSENATLPYEKFFFVGGSNSIRAFQPRRLGPGVYNPAQSGSTSTSETDETMENSDGIITNRIEQPGEVMLEGSVEYRHNIFGFLNGAVFLDFGNVWRIEESNALPGAEFKVDEFYKQIALGTGYGLRLDFSFLIVRFDFGVKLFNPQQVTKLDDNTYNYSEGWMFDKFKGYTKMVEGKPEEVAGFPFGPNQVTFNLGIGYPF